MKENPLSRCIAVFATAAFLWTIALGVSPQLHERIHGGQNTVDHSCAVTFVRSGSFHHAAVPSPVHTGYNGSQIATVTLLNPCWVPCVHFSAAIFEHAPPVIS